MEYQEGSWEDFLLTLMIRRDEMTLRQRIRHSGKFYRGSGLIGRVPLMAAAILWVALIAWTSPLRAALSDTPNQNAWVTNGAVYAVVNDGATTYIGETSPL